MYDFDLVYLEILVKNCIVGMPLKCPICSINVVHVNVCCLFAGMLTLAGEDNQEKSNELPPPVYSMH